MILLLLVFYWVRTRREARSRVVWVIPATSGPVNRVSTTPLVHKPRSRWTRSDVLHRGLWTRAANTSRRRTPDGYAGGSSITCRTIFSTASIV